MADPMGANAQGAIEVFEIERNKEQRDVTAVLSLEKSTSDATKNGDGNNPDPLAHLPERFRKEIEAEAQVVSRKVSFKVPSISERIKVTDRICFDLQDVKTRL